MTQHYTLGRACRPRGVNLEVVVITTMDRMKMRLILVIMILVIIMVNILTEQLTRWQHRLGPILSSLSESKSESEP